MSVPTVAKPIFYLLRTAPYVILLFTAYFMFALTVDDPYITFRYAANILAGHGAVFNIGERVEGYSSPLHLLLSVFLLKTAPGIDILFKAKCASLLFAFVMLAQTGMLARRSSLDAWEVILAQSLVALNINFAIASVNALETTLYGCLLMAVVLVFIEECRTGKGVWSGLLCFVAVLARPDFILIFIALSVIRCFLVCRTKLPLHFLVLWSSLFIVLTGLYELFRWKYYGRWLPNTYYAKSQILTHSIRSGLLYFCRADWTGQPRVKSILHNFSQLQPSNLFAFHSLLQQNIRSGILYLLVTLSFWLLALLGAWGLRAEKPGKVFIAVVGAVSVFILKSGGDWMYGWRFLAPIIPILAVQQCYGLRYVIAITKQHDINLRGVRNSPRSFISRRTVYSICLISLWLACFNSSEHFSWAKVKFSTQGEALLKGSEGFGPLWVAGANYIQRTLPQGCKIAYSEMGYAGYMNMDKLFIDTAGLTDAQIAHLPLNYKSNTGVSDPFWYQQNDPLFRILNLKAPDIIMSLYGAPQDDPLMHYRLTDTINASARIVYIYRRK